jgi:uncharacterized phage protein (TIGR01671 family)
MREIKFRAWASTDFDQNDNPVFEMIYPDRLAISEYGLLADLLKPKDNCIYMQFTGLTDKNGKEIYEGDILKSDDDLFLVEFKEVELGIDDWGLTFKAFCWCFEFKDKSGHQSIVSNGEKSYSFQADQMEIVGNLYQNPDLLK